MVFANIAFSIFFQQAEKKLRKSSRLKSISAIFVYEVLTTNSLKQL